MSEESSYDGPRAVILTAGLDSRLRPLTDTTPSCLLPVAGRPLLEYWLEAVSRAGIRHVMINTHRRAEQIRHYVQTINRRGAMQLTEAYEPTLLGSGRTISTNREFTNRADVIVLIYANSFSDVSLGDLLNYHLRHAEPISMLLCRAENTTAAGFAVLDKDNRVVAYGEEPPQTPCDLADAGVYVIDQAAYREIADWDLGDIRSDILPRWIGRMRGWPIDGVHVCIETCEAYEGVQQKGASLLARQGYDAQGRRPAIFFDRDGTLIEQVHYLSRPEDVQILPGVARAVHSFRQAGYACVVVTNQSAVGRGMITEKDLAEIHDQMCEQFARQTAVFDAIYHCPVVPTVSDRTTVENADRKPGPGMLLTAADELGLDLTRSWMIGDMVSDVLAGKNAGCRGSVLVATGRSLELGEEEFVAEFPQVADVSAAADWILGHRQPSPVGEEQR